MIKNSPPLSPIPSLASILSSIGLLCGIAAAQTPTASPWPVNSDTALVRAVAALVGDSLSRFRDSLHLGTGKRLATDSITDDRPGIQYLKVADPTVFAAHSGSIGDDYPLGPGDVLVLSIWGQKQARYELELDHDGQVQIPSVGVLSLNGVTFGEVHKILAHRLASLYSGVNSGLTQFDVTMQKLKQVRVFVLGDVAKPGGYVLSGNSSALQAVAIAGGPTLKGSDRLVKVARGQTTFDLDLYRYLFLGKRPERDVLQDGDIVRVPPALGTAEVRGAVPRPGRFEVLPGETLGELLAMAGGPGPGSAPNASLLLVHRQGDNLASIPVGKVSDAESSKVVVSVGDVLQVSSQSKARRGSPFISGGVRHPGTYPYTQGLTVRRLVEIAGGPVRLASLARVVVFRFDSLGNSNTLRTNLEGQDELLLYPTDSVIVLQRPEPDSEQPGIEIVGAVVHPGKHAWSAGLRLKDLILLAGGTRSDADLGSIRIEEKDPNLGVVLSRTVSLDTSLRIESDDVALRPSSLVSVPFLPGQSKLFKVKVAGLIRSPETYAMLRPGERTSSLVFRAGGLSPEAYPEGASLIRPAEGRIPLNLAYALRHPGKDDDVVLQDGDSLYVPLRPATVRVSGRVRRPTQVLWRKGKSWDWYVQSAGGASDSSDILGTYVQFADGSICSRSMGIPEPVPGSTVTVPRKDPPREVTSVEKISAFGTIISSLAAVMTVYVLYLATRK